MSISNSFPDYPEPSVSAVCPYFAICGGCDCQDVSYPEQIGWKENYLHQLFSELVPKQSWLPIVACDTYPMYFRGKIRFSFLRGEDGICHPSRHAKGTTSADIGIDRCYLFSPLADKIINLTAQLADKHKWSLYEPFKKRGWLKHVLLRHAKGTNQLMVCLVTGPGSQVGIAEWAEQLKSLDSSIVSCFHLTTPSIEASPIKEELLWGEDHIVEKVGEYYYTISPQAFFQTNALMVDTLYQQIGLLLKPQITDMLWDLYAGSATIGIALSKSVAQVLSIESNPFNCADALWNCTTNGVLNVSIVNNKVEDCLTSSYIREQGFPDLIVVDPPRAGLSPQFKQLLPHLEAKRIVYVSCNPQTALRDCQQLVSTGLRIVNAIAVDMFPHSWHCEVVLVLEPS